MIQSPYNRKRTIPFVGHQRNPLRRIVGNVHDTGDSVRDPRDAERIQLNGIHAVPLLIEDRNSQKDLIDLFGIAADIGLAEVLAAGHEEFSVLKTVHLILVPAGIRVRGQVSHAHIENVIIVNCPVGSVFGRKGSKFLVRDHLSVLLYDHKPSLHRTEHVIFLKEQGSIPAEHRDQEHAEGADQQ